MYVHTHALYCDVYITVVSTCEAITYIFGSCRFYPTSVIMFTYAMLQVCNDRGKQRQ
jgi:hypothetical protein